VHKFITIPILLISLALINVIYASEPDVPLHNKCLYPTVRIDDAAQPGYGSGVIVRSDKVGSEYVNVVITCKHVADELIEPMIRVMAYKNWSEFDNAKSKSYPASVYMAHPRYDLALMIFLSDKKMPVAEIEIDKPIYIGDKITSFGCALRHSPRLEPGQISGVTKGTLRSNIMSVPGDSGGPVFRDYKLIAIKKGFYGVQLGPQPFPVFTFATQQRVSVLKGWGEADARAKTAFEEETPVPQLPVMMMKAKKFTVRPS